MLKVKYLELNPSSGHYGYRSHNFNVIPEKIKALGQKNTLALAVYRHRQV
jgi:hypothetical protein